MLMGKKLKLSETKKETVYTVKNDEDYEEVRNHILCQLVDEQHKVIAITSAGHGEGKTRTCRKLALAFAKLGKKVLIVDAALRNPQIHKIMGLANEKGLTQVLEGRVLLEEAIQYDACQELYILTAGNLTGSSEEELAKDELKRVINELGEQFDYVLINTSPINGHIDAMMLGRMVSGYVMVATAEVRHSLSFQHAEDKLQRVQGKVVSILEVEAQY